MRYERRAATSGDVVLNSSRKSGNTLQYWYWIFMGQNARGKDRWLEFDVRDLAKVAEADLPALITSEELAALRNDDEFELLLQRDLQRVADWCARITAKERLAHLAPRGVVWFINAECTHGVLDAAKTSDQPQGD